jgi:hypothetical protein
VIDIQVRVATRDVMKRIFDDTEMIYQSFSLKSATMIEETLLVSECNKLHRDPKVTLFPNQ